MIPARRGVDTGRGVIRSSLASCVSIAITSKVAIAIIDRRKLERECLARVAAASRRVVAISAHESVAAWRAAATEERPTTILLNLGGRHPASGAAREEIGEAVAAAGSFPVVVLAESEEPGDILAAIEAGAKGYIPASIGVDSIVEAALLTSTGGSFLPASAVEALRSVLGREHVEEPAVIDAVAERFTPRQAAVADALRRGKANKIIAYELNMCEGTVKVHIRAIMKRLRASNRTQAAFRLNSLFARQADA